MEIEKPVVEQEKKQDYSPPVLTELGAMKERTLTGTPGPSADGGSVP